MPRDECVRRGKNQIDAYTNLYILYIWQNEFVLEQVSERDNRHSEVTLLERIQKVLMAQIQNFSFNAFLL